MEKTVVVVAANSLSSAACGQNITFDLTLGKTKAPASSAASKSIIKNLWSCAVEAVCEYCRIVFDLFPDQNQVCVAAVDEAKCQPINSWRDEDQEIGKVLSGFQKFGAPLLQSPQGRPPQGQGGAPAHLSPCLQGLQYAVRCLAQLTATQYAVMTCTRKVPPNQGRILFLCTLKSPGDVKELEKAIVSMVRAENADIKQKSDPARLQIQHCQLVVVHTHPSPPTGGAPSSSSEVKDCPLSQVSSQVSSVVYSFPGRILLEKCISLTKLHFNLKSTIITGIPMKEEQVGGSSANYDVELIHLAEAHRDVLRAGYNLGPMTGTKKESKEHHGKEIVMLKWSTPKSAPLELQFCTSAYRVTPSNVTSRPTICLINFVLSGKPVLLEQYRKGSVKVISHVLTSHAGTIFLHCIPGTRSHIDEPPSISEGRGGRITDYRISDFSEVVSDNLLSPIPVDRTKIPTVYPLQLADKKLERETRHWPMTYNGTVVFSMKQDLEPLPFVMIRDAMSEAELEECKKVIQSLQAKESNNEPLPLPSGGRSKGVKRDEQYHSLWSELETMAQLCASFSDLHGQLAQLIAQAAASSPCVQQAAPRKTPKAENGTPVTTPTAAAAAAGGKKELGWQELDMYQQMTEREKKDFSSENRNNDHGVWKQQTPSSSLHQQAPLLPNQLSNPAKPVSSLLAIWSSRERKRATGSHAEFAGRVNFIGRPAKLYSAASTHVSSVLPPLDRDSYT